MVSGIWRAPRYAGRNSATCHECIGGRTDCTPSASARTASRSANTNSNSSASASASCSRSGIQHSARSSTQSAGNPKRECRACTRCSGVIQIDQRRGGALAGACSSDRSGTHCCNATKCASNSTNDNSNDNSKNGC